ncbi:unnamed protein product [Penicillium nalgiovense]|uniref:Uncharacterized protein n=2 Tax=Penicillium nalgiovense TaxID=60175 RepID=A0A9W4HCX8_PENNA|nr:unnamed protein product [Penicillium nalgiovense]CAG7939788.1 unnamed protein product [Penicillium nalgiovense]CAG7952276.1 unnamed protein product [Penicillium nalgiovense]CAG7953331.1 unnamed protein product [Penicillium nalgiovense]CAG7953770.1 unnamed protein product [Penicillium nalgiovense]
MTSSKAYYHLPDALIQEDVFSFLHNHTALAHLFWPLAMKVDESTNPTSTIFNIGSAAKEKATITSATDEVVCEEELPFGLRMRMVYRVINTSVGGYGNGVSGSSDRLILPESRLCLEEERSVTAPRPLSLLLNLKDGPIPKTLNLLRALNEFARNGKDVDLTLAPLPAPTADPDDVYEMGKSKKN